MSEVGHYMEVVARQRNEIWELEAEVERLREELADTETEKIERGTEILRLREFIGHTSDEYGERMPSQWKAHARAALRETEAE